jgi:hypothetical protein
VQVSWSLMRAYERCPLQTKLIYIDKLGPERVDERRFIRGSVGHKFIEEWAKKGFCESMTPEDAGRIFKDLVSRKHIVWLHDKDEAQLHERVIEDAAKIQSAIRYNELFALRGLQVEKWISKPFMDGAHTVKGVLDMVAYGGTWLLETKLTTDPKWIDPDQLFFYGYLLAMANKRYPRRLSFFLPLIDNVQDRLVDVKFSKSDFSKMYGRMKDFIQKWSAGEFPAIGSIEDCKWCEVKAHCQISNS